MVIWKDLSVAVIAALASFLGASAAKPASTPPLPLAAVERLLIAIKVAS